MPPESLQVPQDQGAVPWAEAGGDCEWVCGPQEGGCASLAQGHCPALESPQPWRASSLSGTELALERWLRATGPQAVSWGSCRLQSQDGDTGGPSGSAAPHSPVRQFSGRVTGSPSSWDYGSRPVPTVVLCVPALPRVAQVQARAWPAQGWTSTPTPSEGKGRSHPTCEPRLGLGAGQGLLVALAFCP